MRDQTSAGGGTNEQFKTSLPSEDRETFRSAIRGELLQPEDSGYDDARVVWNAIFDRRPRLIVRCAGVADVLESIGFARRHGLLLSVRGGGHNVAGYAVCDDGLMVDLSAMNAVRVDPSARRAWVREERFGAMLIGRRPLSIWRPQAASFPRQESPG